MIKTLVLARANFCGDRLPPFLSIVEDGVDVEDNSTEWIHTVLDHLTDLELGVTHFFHDRAVPNFSHTPYRAAIAGSLVATSFARSRRTLACFQVASSCIFPSIITAPVPSGIAAKIFSANFTSATSGEKTR